MMNRLVAVLAVVMLATLASARGAELDFPNQIAAFEFLKKTTYDEPRLGYSLRYEKGTAMKADIYIYDNGYKGLKDGINSAAAKAELQNTVAALEAVAEYGIYLDLKQQESDTKAFEGVRTEFLWLRHTMKQKQKEGEPTPLISDSLLRVTGGKFVKIRITTTNGDLEDHAKGVDAFVRVVATTIDKQTD